jgi:hypothetical protein
MTVYRNVSGDDRILMTGSATGTLVPAGAEVEVLDEGLIAGLVGQESLWEPVVAPAPREKKG